MIWKKLNSSFNLVSHQSDNDKTYSYAKNSYEAKYQFLIHKRENTSLKHFNDSKAFIEYLNDKSGIYRTIEEHSSNKKTELLLMIWLLKCLVMKWLI